MLALFILLLISFTQVLGQQIGRHTPEVHPKLSWQQCAAGGHCTTHQGGIVFDAEWRWLHDAHDKSCMRNDGKPDPAICPDVATCAKNCEFEGIDYKAHGVSTSGHSLHQIMQHGSRLYLTTNDSTHYERFHMLNKEISFDVDTSKVPCGANGAIYLVAMEADGGMARMPHNKAGAKYGMSYCDGQCTKNFRFVPPGQGACCAEIDMWEANSKATVLTAHPCSIMPYHLCAGTACDGAVCEKDGCGLNPYQTGNHHFYGPGMTVDTNKVFTVVTQFITSGGHLSEIRRLYVQGGKVIPNAHSSIGGNSMDDHFCAGTAKQSFGHHGGLKHLGEAINAGMVLVFALWDDATQHMQWMDGGKSGPCTMAEGDPKVVESHNPYIVWSNIKVGPINSTFHH